MGHAWIRLAFLLISQIPFLTHELLTDSFPLFSEISFSREEHLGGSHPEGYRDRGGRGSFRGLGHSDDVSSFLCPDLEKRKNPVCHFVTPLDGSVEVDEHRRPEVLGL